MTDSELEAVLIEEPDTVERTVSVQNTDKFGEAICAFANDLPDHRRPGVLFVGIHNDGSCAHLDITDQLLHNLASIRSNGNLLPQPSMTVEKRRIGGCDLAVVTVQPASDTPVRYKGAIWIRIGPHRGLANAQDERILVEKRQYRENQIASLKHYRSLMPMAQEARKPIFHLKPADGALGAHLTAANAAGKEFGALSRELLFRAGLLPVISSPAKP